MTYPLNDLGAKYTRELAHIWTQYRCHDDTVGLRRCFIRVFRRKQPWNPRISAASSASLSNPMTPSELPVEVVSAETLSSSTESSKRWRDFTNDSVRCIVFEEHWVVVHDILLKILKGRIWKIKYRNNIDPMIPLHYIHSKLHVKQYRIYCRNESSWKSNCLQSNWMW